jgi:hypothetical protein
VSNREVLLLVSVDTEEDNWVPTRTGITVENIRELKCLSGFFDKLDVRTTYFTTYQVAMRPWAVELLREICDGGRAEIGAHLHPWNTPPAEEPLSSRNTMMKNLDPELQLKKLERLTSAVGDAFGAPPTAFRAGRFGLGAEAVPALLACGYQVDSSVTPFVNWEATDDGPNFVGASLDAYRVGTGRDLRVPAPDGPLVEIPITWGYNRFASGRWPGLHRVLHTRFARAVHLAGLASRLGLAKRTVLSPELESVQDMLAISRGALEGGVRHLHLFFHSVSLRPGLSPWTSSVKGVERMYAAISSYLEGLSRTASVRLATVSEARRALGFGAPDVQPPSQVVTRPCPATRAGCS